MSDQLPSLGEFSPNAEYPVSSKQAAGLVDGIRTEVMVLSFTDKIMITMSQEGRLAQWMQVPMDTTSPARGENYLPSADGDLVPMSSLTAFTLLGGANAERELTGQLYASQLASLIASKSPEESRTVLVGLGLTKAEVDRKQFFDMLELVTRCL